MSDESPPATSAAETLSVGRKVLYGGPTLWVSAMFVPVSLYMSKFYADVVLAPLAWLALAVALARSFDAVTDPLMGWLSDHTRSRWGRRRPYIALGSVMLALAFALLFSPPERLDPGTATVWFGACFLSFFLCHTIFGIPYNALGPELSLDYHERSSVFSWRESFALLGTIVGAGIPGLLAAQLDYRLAYIVFGVGCGIGLIVTSMVTAVRIRERPEFATRESNPIVPGVRRSLTNRPFRILLTSYAVGSVTAAIPGTLLPFFIQYVIQPENVVFWTTIGVMSHFVAALAAIPIFLWASRRFGKRPLWLTAYGMSILSLLSAFYLGKGDILEGALVFAWAGVAFGGQLLLTPSIQADVIDYDELHTGKRREAQYGALWSFLPKFVAIPGAAIPFSILASLGYQPNVEQSPEVIFALRSLLGLLPAAFAALAFVVAWRFPITEAIHRRIQEGIALHARGEAAVDPLTGEIIQPPGRREVDEETGWVLDHFSRGELRRAERTGVRALVRGASLSLAGSLLALAAGIALAVQQIGGLESEPGLLAVVAITGSGLALAAVAFHAVRLRVALGLQPGSVAPSLLRAHRGDATALAAGGG
ncbi:MAG: MFS transporter [Myxococcota bacterium]|nr:MFS transporter [Myxococcota bacterium]